MEFDLVFEGGGAKGSVFAGALKEFEDQGHTGRRLIGTSAGAITATLMAAGYDSGMMLQAINEKLPNAKPRFSSFMDIPDRFEQKDIQNSLTYSIFKKVDIPWVPELMENTIDDKIFDQLMKLDAYRETFSFIERGGLYAGNAFVKWMEEKLNSYNLNLGGSTLLDFHNKTNKELSLVASDTMGHTMLILNHITAPNCPVVMAVRMSMSIPFVWQEVKWQKDWGNYRGKDISGHTIVDGGVLSNFPINLLISDDEAVKEIMGNTDPNSAPTLGLLIDETLEVKNSGIMEGEDGTEELEGGLLSNVRRLKTVNRVLKLIDTMTDAHDKFYMRAYKENICYLPAKGYGTTEFNMSDKRLNALVNGGKEAMKRYLETLHTVAAATV